MKKATQRKEKNRVVDQLRVFVKKFQAVELNTAAAVRARIQASRDKKRTAREKSTEHDLLRSAKRDFQDAYGEAHGRMPDKEEMQKHCNTHKQSDFSGANSYNYHEKGGQVGENQKVVDPRGQHTRDRKAWREAVPSQKPT